MLTRDEFRALIARRDELSLRHERAVLLLEEQGPDGAHVNRRKCAKLYDELEAIQRRIDSSLAEMRSK